MQVRPLVIVAVMVLVGGCSDAETSTSSTVTEPLITTTTTSTLVPTTTTTTTTSTSTTATTTAPITTTASSTTTATTPAVPMLDVTDPTNGAVVSTQVYTFRGVTDPGCSVSVGDKYYADVDADGTWSLDLKLRVGGNTTTFVASDPTGHTTKAQIAVDYLPDLTLRPDGLGPFDFGDPAAEVEAGLIAILGPPTGEHGMELCGACGASFDRGIFWHDGLYVEFDEETRVGYFSGWATHGTALTWDGGKGLQLVTVEGIGPGATFEAMAATFGDDLDITEDHTTESCSEHGCAETCDWWAGQAGCCCGWRWNVEDATTERLLFIGYLSGSEQDPSTTMTWMGAGSMFWTMC